MSRLAACLWLAAFLLPAAAMGAPFGNPEEPGDDPGGEILWAAASLQRILAERDYPAILSLALLARNANGPPAAPPGAGPSDAPPWLDTVEILSEALSGAPAARLEGCRGLPDPVEGTLCAVEALTPLLPREMGRGLADEGARLLSTYLRPGEAPPPGVAGLPGGLRFGGEGLRYGPLQVYAEAVLEDALRLRGWFPNEWNPGAEGSDEAGHQYVELLSSLAGFSLTASASEILQGASGLRFLLQEHPGIAALEGSAGTIGATIVEGRTFMQDFQGFLSSVEGSATGFYGTVVDVESGIPAALDWASQRSFVYLASRTATLGGIEGGVAERIRALGNVATDLRLEGRAFRSNLAEFGQQMAFAAMSGNVLSLAAGVADFLQLTPGALGGAAAEDLRAIRSLLGDLQGEMAAGFEGIDVRLDEVLGELDQGFARMESLVTAGQLATLGELGRVGDELRTLSGRIDRLDANLVTYLEAGFDRDYVRTMIVCLEHRERHLPPFDRIEFSVFSSCLADFRARGARDARDALLTDRTTSVDDVSLIPALADRRTENLSHRLPLLARVAEQRFGYAGLGGGRGGANPVEWAVASQAYLSMLDQWPEHATLVTSGDLNALLSTGLEIQRMLNAIVRDPVTGELGGVLLPVLASYEAASAALTAEAEILASRYQQAQLRRVDPTTVLTRMTPGAPSSAERPTLPTPGRITAAIPPVLRTATVLALEEPNLVYRTIQTDSVTRENRGRRWGFLGRRHDRITHTRTTIEVELRTRQGEVISAFRAPGEMVLVRVEEMSGDTLSDRVRSVHEQVADPTGHFLSSTFPILAESLASWEVRPPDPAILRRLEDAVEEEFRRFESSSLNRVFSAVCQVGDPPLLDETDRRSAERIRASLDTMSTARTLLDVYVRLGIPALLEEDPVVREALSSGSGLLDRAGLCGVVAAGESPLRVVWLEEEPRTRAVELRWALEEGIGEHFGTAGFVTPSIVDATIQQLRAAIRLQELRVRVAG